MTTPTDSPEPDKRYCGCCYCGKCWEYEGREPSDELVKEVGDHESVCPKNPYTNRIKDLEAEVERLVDGLERSGVDAKRWQEQAEKAEAEVERLKVIVKAQQNELEAISCALGTNEGHSSVDHIVTLKDNLRRAVEIKFSTQ